MAEDDSRPWWPSRPFGYTADPDPVSGRWWTVRRDTSKKIVAINEIRKHPTEAKLLKDAYLKFLAGSSTRSLAKFWNDAGVLTPRGNKWSGSAIHALLAAPRNAGLREYNGEVVTDVDGHFKRGTWPEIVTEDTWRTAYGILKDPSRRRGGTRARKHLLVGIVRCGRPECGATLRSTVSNRGTHQYVCKECQRLSRDLDKVDALIVDAVVGRLSREDAVDLLRPPVAEVDANALPAERKTLEERLAQLGREFASAPPAFTKAALDEISGRLKDINELLTDPGRARVFEGLIGVKDVRKAFTSLDLGRRRTVVDVLMTIKIMPVTRGSKIFDPDAIVVVWKEDEEMVGHRV